MESIKTQFLILLLLLFFIITIIYYVLLLWQNTMKFGVLKQVHVYIEVISGRQEDIWDFL